MARFEIEANGKRFEVDAPSIDAAMEALGASSQSPAPPQPAPPKQYTVGDKADAVARGAVDSITLGTADEIAGGLGGAVDWIRGNVLGEEGRTFQGGYERTSGNARRIDAEQAENLPGYRMAGQVVGAVPLAAVPGIGVARAASFGGKLGAGIAGGGVTGAAYGAGSAEGGLDERAAGALDGAWKGALVGGAVPLAGRAVGKAIGTRAGEKAVPVVEDLKAASQRMYDAANQIGVRLKPGRLGQAVNTMIADLRLKGVDPDLHPRTYAALNRIAASKDVASTLQDLEILRRVASAAAQTADKSERFMASRVVEKLDDFMTNLKPDDVLSGSPKKAVETLKEARRLWGQSVKGEILADAMKDAQVSASGFSGSGLENAIRSEFRKLSKNKKMMQRFSSPERVAIIKIAMGGPIENLLRYAGKLAPTGIVSSALSSGLGLAAGGPAGAVALPAIGFAARQAATAATKRNVGRADALVRNAGVVPFDEGAARLAEQRAEQLLETLGRGGVVPSVVGEPVPVGR